MPVAPPCARQGYSIIMRLARRGTDKRGVPPAYAVRDGRGTGMTFLTGTRHGPAKLPPERASGNGRNLAAVRDTLIAGAASKSGLWISRVRQYLHRRSNAAWETQIGLKNPAYGV